jgi:thiol-disulfide isomerase/thioredoxin
MRIIYFILLLVLIFLVGCSTNPMQTGTSDVIGENLEKKLLPSSWLETELKDIDTQQTFKISDFKGKPILLESFAVWCPTCTRQQQEIQKLHEEIGDDVISITLNTDPNEDESEVKEHLDRNGFNWLYSISSEQMTRELIDEFGIGFVNAPSAPVVLICEDQATKVLPRGVKSKDDLKQFIAQGC